MRLGILLPLKGLSEEDSIELLTGPFTNFITKVDTIDPKQHILVLIDFMGQKIRMQVTADQFQLAKYVPP